MSKHLQRDIDSLNTELLNISSMVEDMIDKATQALAERRYDLADEVVKADEYVDAHEVHVEEECLKMLALHQPVAVDLRRIATVMKVNNDLERMADLAVSIAQRAQAVDPLQVRERGRRNDELQLGPGERADCMVTLDAHDVRTAGVAAAAVARDRARPLRRSALPALARAAGRGATGHTARARAQLALGGDRAGRRAAIAAARKRRRSARRGQVARRTR